MPAKTTAKTAHLTHGAGDIMERVDLILYGDPADRGDEGDGDELMLIVSWPGKLPIGRCSSDNRRS